MDDRFFTACFPGSARICGRYLKDFTPFHYLILKALDSPFMRADGMNRPADLLAAICACRHSFGDDIDMRPRVRDFAWRVWMTCRPKVFRRECEKFAAWMAAHSSGPRFWTILEGGQKTRDLTGPEVLTLLVPLMMKTSISEAEAWNMSLGRAQWINAEISEFEGSDRRFLYESDLLDEEETNA